MTTDPATISLPRKRPGVFARLLRRRAARCAVVVIAIPLLGWLGFRAAVRWWPYPHGIEMTPSAATLLQDRNGMPLAAFVAGDGQWRLPLSADQVSPHLLDALVAVEDSRFYEHHGIDWRSAAMAGWQDARSLHIRRGASTLTMQVQRLRDPRPRTFFNKFEQAVRAAQLEQRQTKQQILIEYVNRAPFGGNLVGAGAASWRYFGRPCAQLSLAEAALLAGLPQSPNWYRPDKHPQAAVARRNHVLDRMRDMGMIDAKQHDEAIAEPVTATWKPLPQDRPADQSPADGALPTLATLAGRRAGSNVLTTFDSATQRQTYAAVSEHLARLESSGVTSAAVVVLDTQSAECLAAVSLSRNAAQVDLTRSVRSTGSTLKPFIYAAAFEAGICAPETVLEDSPVAWSGYEPADYDRKFRGSITVADALAESRNIPAMLVLAQVGVEPAVGLMEAAGLKTLAKSPGRYGLSLAIGGAEASPMELAQAYAMLARGGRTREVVLVSRPASVALIESEFSIRDAEVSGFHDADGGRISGSLSPVHREEGWGEGTFVEQPKLPQAFDVPYASSASAKADPAFAPRDFSERRASSVSAGEDAALVANRAAETALRRHGPTGGSNSNADNSALCISTNACWQTLTALSGSDRTLAICPAAEKTHVAWKTGTSNGHRDAWCAAVTRRRTIVVWLGNANGQGSPALVGAEAAAPLALQLIASLDPATAEPWPIVPSEPTVAKGRSRSAANTSLSLISPTAGQQFVLDPDVPAQRQRVLLKASLHASKPGDGSDSRTLWWFVDGQPAGVGEAGAQLWWPPTIGRHEIRVIDAHGHGAVAEVGVK